jgi:hypothetical protein
MVRKHNNPDNSYHLKLFEFCVIGYELQAARGIVRINFSSMWMLLNALRSIQAGWVFQLKGDVTGDVCRADIDLLQLSVTSMPCQNNVPCISTIPHQTESEQTYAITWDDLRTAVCSACTILHCCNDSCACCRTVFELLRDPEVDKYLRSRNSVTPNCLFTRPCATTSRVWEFLQMIAWSFQLTSACRMGQVVALQFQKHFF